MIPWLFFLGVSIMCVGAVGAWCVRSGFAKPSAVEGWMWVIALGLAVCPFLKDGGSFAWFMAPSVVLSPWANWVVLVVYLMCVPVRSIYYLSHADAAIEDLSQGAVDLGAPFFKWLDSAAGGGGLRRAETSFGFMRSPEYRVSNIVAPVTKGVFRPLVVLPLAWLPDEILSVRGRELRASLGLREQQSPESVCAAILHELGHHRGRDPHRAWLRLCASLIIPFEWTLTALDLKRFDQAQLGLLERAVHEVFFWTRWPIQWVVQRAWAFQEARADEGAAQLVADAGERLEHLRGGQAPWAAEARLARGSRPANWACLALMGGLGLGGFLLAPSRPLLAMAFGGDGGLVSMLPRGYSIEVLENAYGDRPEVLFRPPTRLHGGQVEYKARPDSGPVQLGKDPLQGLDLYTRAYLPDPIPGPVRYAVTWEFWRTGPQRDLPMVPVFVMVRPVESAAVSKDPRTLTYFGTEPSDYKLEDLGGGHYRAQWTTELPAGRRASYLSIEMKAFLPGEVIFNSPIINKL